MALSKNQSAFAELPAALIRELETYCEVTGEEPWGVIADALTLHFDELELAVLTDPTSAAPTAAAR